MPYHLAIAHHYFTLLRFVARNNENYIVLFGKCQARFFIFSVFYFPFSSSLQCVITGIKEPECMQIGGNYEYYETHPADRLL